MKTTETTLFHFVNGLMYESIYLITYTWYEYLLLEFVALGKQIIDEMFNRRKIASLKIYIFLYNSFQTRMNGVVVLAVVIGRSKTTCCRFNKPIHRRYCG